MSIHPFNSAYLVKHHKEAGYNLTGHQTVAGLTHRSDILSKAKLETPVNLTPQTACLWIVVGSWSTQGEPRQSPDRKAVVLMVDSNCEVTVLTTAPPCRHVLRYIERQKRLSNMITRKRDKNKKWDCIINHLPVISSSISWKLKKTPKCLWNK